MKGHHFVDGIIGIVDAFIGDSTGLVAKCEFVGNVWPAHRAILMVALGCRDRDTEEPRQGHRTKGAGLHGNHSRDTAQRGQGKGAVMTGA